MIKHVKGDLIKMALNGDFNLIVHGCNCFCTMGGGIALQIARNFPRAEKVDRLTKAGANKLGTMTIAEQYVERNGHPHKLLVVNAYTQFGFSDGQKDVFDYEGFPNILRQIHGIGTSKKIGMPLIGTGLARGDWNRILGHIEHNLGDLNVTIVEYAP